jgi:hypothetical protein
MYNNTIDMGGTSYYGYNSSVVKVAVSTINEFIFTGNIVRLYFPNHTDNKDGGLIISIYNLETMISENNLYMDISADDDNISTAIINTDPSSSLYLYYITSVSELQGSGYETNSIVRDLSADIFTNTVTRDYSLTANGYTDTNITSGQYALYDNNYKTPLVDTQNSGALFFSPVDVDETDISVIHDAVNINSGLSYEDNANIESNSTDIIFMETDNLNRSVVIKWDIYNAVSDDRKIILGKSGFISVLSNVDEDGLYLSDALYTITKTIL